MIEVQAVSRKYGDLVAVDNVSFSISRGEIVGLLGHNGAGKSTIMRMLTGYLEPTAGFIKIDGLEIGEKRLEIQRKIGYLSENAPLYPDMSVLQYLEYVAKLRAVPYSNRSEAIRKAVARAGLVDHATDSVNTLSKGYKQRLGVAQAIVHDPEILILDEPTNGLDPSQIFEMRSLVKSLSANATVILSTHILQEVEAVCQRVIIMVQGRIGLDARLSELQQSNRLVVAMNDAPEEAKDVLGNLNGVRGVQPLEDRLSYLLDLDAPPARVAPRVAKAAVQRGWDLFKITEEERTLEAVFREVSEERSHG